MGRAYELTDGQWELVADLFDPPWRRGPKAKVPRRQTRRRSANIPADQAMATLRRLLTYKAAWYGTDLVVADRWYPSSKSCSTQGCGHVHADLGRGEARWTCPACCTTQDRDHNAAVNLARWPARSQPKAA